MDRQRLQPRPLYGIGTVARLTGVKPDTLRVWERRYQLGASYKSASGRRQYSQADLEHLQLVAALVSCGTRIGEIANSERRTLEMLLRARDDDSVPASPEKPRVLFVGEALCAWLDEHQGCLANVDALLAPCALEKVNAEMRTEAGQCDGLVVECPSPIDSTDASLTALSSSLGAASVLLLHHRQQESRLTDLRRQGYAADSFPPDPVVLAVHLSGVLAQRELAQGSDSIGDLVPGRPRLFDELELATASTSGAQVEGMSPQQVAQLVQALARFESHSATCAVRNWQDVSVSACVYAYVGQARWLMERALALTVDANAATPA